MKNICKRLLLVLTCLNCFVVEHKWQFKNSISIKSKKALLYIVISQNLQTSITHEFLLLVTLNIFHILFLCLHFWFWTSNCFPKALYSTFDFEQVITARKLFIQSLCSKKRKPWFFCGLWRQKPIWCGYQHMALSNFNILNGNGSF